MGGKKAFLSSNYPKKYMLLHLSSKVFAFVEHKFCICQAECRYSCRSWLSDWPVREKWSARHNGEKSLRAHILELDKGTHGQKSIYPPSIMAELRALLLHILWYRLVQIRHGAGNWIFCRSGWMKVWEVTLLTWYNLRQLRPIFCSFEVSRQPRIVALTLF